MSSALQVSFGHLYHNFVSKMKHVLTPNSNQTSPELSAEMSPPSNDHTGITLQVVFGIIAFLAVFGNLMFCIVLLRKRFLLKKPYNVLLLVLAVTDMLTGRKKTMIFFFHKEITLWEGKFIVWERKFIEII